MHELPIWVDDAPGFVVDYVRIDHSKYPPEIHPCATREELISSGFVPAGGKIEVKTLNAGWEYQQEKLKRLGVKVGDIFTVKSCRVGGPSSYYELEEIEGEHNTVFFKEHKE
jgi:hypothetical protein